jgi:cell division protein FtsB
MGERTEPQRPGENPLNPLEQTLCVVIVGTFAYTLAVLAHADSLQRGNDQAAQLAAGLDEENLKLRAENYALRAKNDHLGMVNDNLSTYVAALERGKNRAIDHCLGLEDANRRLRAEAGCLRIVSRIRHASNAYLQRRVQGLEHQVQELQDLVDRMTARPRGANGRFQGKERTTSIVARGATIVLNGQVSRWDKVESRIEMPRVVRVTSQEIADCIVEDVVEGELVEG